MTLEAAARAVDGFQRGNLTDRLASLERSFAAATGAQTQQLCDSEMLGDALLSAALALKAAAGQVNTLIHALGILVALPRILEPDERVEYLSLGAGNTGRAFDLATDRRIAEFKFIHWTGGSETIRQNSLFKDFFGLAEAPDRRRKHLYVLGLDKPLRFLNGRRAISSVLSKNSAVADRFRALYGTCFTVVREYYLHRHREVDLANLLLTVPALASQTGRRIDAG